MALLNFRDFKTKLVSIHCDFLCVQGSSSQKYPQLSKKIEVKATKKKGRMLVAKEQIEPGKYFFMGFRITLGAVQGESRRHLWAVIFGV